MKIGKACGIFLNIRASEYPLEEKAAAIKAVLDMPTHNGISKDKMLDVLRWLLDLLFITTRKYEHTNADRIREMSDADLADYLLGISTAECPFRGRVCAGSCRECWMGWLEEQAKEV